jgi:benzylsuccinate CoA-transferase BbsF subunit
MGNRLPWSAPEGVYPSKADDTWVAISADDDRAWAGLCEVAGLGDPADLPTVGSRIEAHDRLDAEIAAWTSTVGAAEATALLQAAGCAAHPVLDIESLVSDPQIRARGWYRVRPSERLGRDLLGGQPVGLSDPVPDLAVASAPFGRHTRELLADLAGLDDTEIDKLMARGAAFDMTDPTITLRRPYDSWLGVLVPGCGDDDRTAGGPR